MTDVKRFDEIATEEEYKKAYDIVKTLADFNGFFCGNCKHKIEHYSRRSRGSGTPEGLFFPTFCPYCRIKLKEMDNIPSKVTECKKCHIEFVNDTKNFCPSCGDKLVQKIVTGEGFDTVEPSTSFYDKYKVRF